VRGQGAPDLAGPEYHVQSILTHDRVPFTDPSSTLAVGDSRALGVYGRRYGSLRKLANNFLNSYDIHADVSNEFPETKRARLWGMRDWSFLTNHARVLLCIAQDPGARLRDIAASLGVTERSAHGIITDLVDAGYVIKQRDGRRNRYQIDAGLPLREPGSREPAIGEVLAVLLRGKDGLAGADGRAAADGAGVSPRSR